MCDIILFNAVYLEIRVKFFVISRKKIVSSH